MKSRRTREERHVIARRIFEALCEHYPDRYVALVEQLGSTELTPSSTRSSESSFDSSAS